ncbi:alpha/beta hydrolase, partial [Neisseria gonorrhoeae]
LTDILVPIFAVGTEKDHVAPWRSVFKLHHLTDTDVTFVLTTGGHNAGIVSEPGHKNRSFQMATKNSADRDTDPETWRTTAPRFEGSWWPVWQSWLARHSTGRIAPPPLGNPATGLAPIADAPGTYVLER